MRLHSVLPALTLTLISAPSFAAMNTSEITQSGDGNTAELMQTGNSNQAIQTQLGTNSFQRIEQNGDTHYASVYQAERTEDAEATIVQTGDNHSVDIYQGSGSSVDITQTGSANVYNYNGEGSQYASSTQDGTNNIHTINQSGSNYSAALTTSIGNGNAITLNQDAGGSFGGFNVTQVGDNNAITATQRDYSVQILGDQRGNANTVVIEQAGVGPTSLGGSTVVGFDQQGDTNIINVTQSLSADSDITQIGNANNVSAVQSGNGGDMFSPYARTNLTSTQTGDNNTLTVYQSAYEGIADIAANQEGNGNTMDLVQESVINSSLDVAQLGDNNYMSITQRQTVNDAFQLTQQGSGLSVTTERGGQDNQAVIAQTGLSNSVSLIQQ
ncbi:hypothetical protein IQ22_03084 [Pseudomonas duriflava]|uniref:Curlin associated repeat-containing protein n=1 Tax=Pseudomonas duriflava TaxID=459528 RepID=A0A562Q7L9_9PSED|nr:hypothetical protein [Pseudomonas duriflava]TWI52708.1 hypothetical protein IQ22_03084 [Pseudomonas duriflava]